MGISVGHDRSKASSFLYRQAKVLNLSDNGSVANRRVSLFSCLVTRLSPIAQSTQAGRKKQSEMLVSVCPTLLYCTR